MMRDLRAFGAVGLLAGLLVACDLGGGGGGGPSPMPIPERPFPEINPSVDTTSVAVGARLYVQYGCEMCHGKAAVGGVENANSDTGGKINGLTLVKEGYTLGQLEAKIGEGVPSVGKTNPDGPTPPLRMPPYHDVLTPKELSAIAEYLMSLFPKDREVEDDWDD